MLNHYTIHKARAVQRCLSEPGGRIVLHLRLWKQMHDHVTRNHRHRTIDTLVDDVRRFRRHAQPFPGIKVSTMREAA